tara:strand:- start:341 stop:928 length:588 start_codon:yes stop_codon:yes gene_type:complete
MSSVVISGDTSGTVTLAAPAVAGSNTITLQAATATMSVNTLATAVASTSGTSIDFTSLPSWIKRITVMFSGVSVSGTSQIQVQLGTSGGVVATGYLGSVDSSATTVGASTFTTGLALERAAGATAAGLRNGLVTFANLTSNTWAGSALIGYSSSGLMSYSATSVPLGGTLDRVRITTVNGTDTFDAGTINILYEG